jgi:EAL domain-containing protein (putative c-di-GMP-specific phosphodiesterase class I)
MQLLELLPVQFVKIDGSFMGPINNDEQVRDKVESLIEKAKSQNIETVAERVENANTMAVLWQLGVSYIQGNYVQEPEVVMAAD